MSIWYISRANIVIFLGYIFSSMVLLNNGHGKKKQIPFFQFNWSIHSSWVKEKMWCPSLPPSSRYNMTHKCTAAAYQYELSSSCARPSIYRARNKYFRNVFLVEKLLFHMKQEWKNEWVSEPYCDTGLRVAIICSFNGLHCSCGMKRYFNFMWCLCVCVRMWIYVCVWRWWVAGGLSKMHFATR